MTTEQLRHLHTERPFKPFDIHLADGRTLAIDHPECLAHAPGSRTIGVAHSNGVIESVDLLLVVSLKPRENGSSKRGRPRR